MGSSSKVVNLCTKCVKKKKKKKQHKDEHLCVL